MSKVRSIQGEPLIRIGELARRAGLPTATLRAWERRYGVVTPQRGSSGYRLYSASDERRLRSMVSLIGQGLAPAEAAERVLGAAAEIDGDAAGSDTAQAPQLRADLLEALLAFDNEEAERIMDRALAALSADAFVSEIALPTLRLLGEGWVDGDVTIGQEHFASNVLRGRMLGLARGWGGGAGSLALLACPPGEFHDLGLVGFGVALRGLGWRVTFLGADTPISTINACAEEIEPDAVVVCAMDEDLIEDVAGELATLASRSQLLLAGPGATTEAAARMGAAVLADDPVAAAGSLAA